LALTVREAGAVKPSVGGRTRKWLKVKVPYYRDGERVVVA